MECPRCRAELPPVAHFCHVCGQDQRSADLARRRSFAAKPDEPVASFAQDESGKLYLVGYEGTLYRLDFTGSTLGPT